MNRKKMITYLFLLAQFPMLAWFGVAFAQEPMDIPKWLSELQNLDPKLEVHSARPFTLLNLIREGDAAAVTALVADLNREAEFFEKLWSVMSSDEFVDYLRVPHRHSGALKDSGEVEFLNLIIHMAEIYRTHMLTTKASESGVSVTAQYLLEKNRFDLVQVARKLAESFGWRLSHLTGSDVALETQAKVFARSLFPEVRERILRDDMDVYSIDLNDESWGVDLKDDKGEIRTISQDRVLRLFVIDDISKVTDRLVDLYQTVLIRLLATENDFSEDLDETFIRERIRWLYEVRVQLVFFAIEFDQKMRRLQHARFSGAAFARGVNAYQTENDPEVTRNLTVGVEHICWLLRDVYRGNEPKEFLKAFFGVNDEMGNTAFLFQTFHGILKKLLGDIKATGPDYHLALKSLEALASLGEYFGHHWQGAAGTVSITKMHGLFYAGILKAQTVAGVFSTRTTWPLFTTVDGAKLAATIFPKESATAPWLDFATTHSVLARMLRHPIK